MKKELLPMKKHQIDFLNGVLWIPDSKTPNGVAEIPLTKLSLEAFQNQVAISGSGEFVRRCESEDWQSCQEAMGEV